jgi:hypothetical protein
LAIEAGKGDLFSFRARLRCQRIFIWDTLPSTRLQAPTPGVVVVKKLTLFQLIFLARTNRLSLFV